ncbi:MAG: SHOCT domain-containing protein [Actinobacteria bacterium]|nr:SHOCT domain-containing protein [Actinomycetota bacterium]
MPLAEFSLSDALVTTLAVFLFVMWFWIVITILTDLFRDPDTSGFGKAAWMLCLIILPYLTGLVYLIARGQGMRDRAIRDQAEAKAQMDDYIRSTAGGASAADELAKLVQLRDSGAISAAEFESMKAKYVG